jgi:GNAT superfamily N-acetyltransferase
MKKLAGLQMTDKYGNSIEFVTELPKQVWSDDYKFNQSIVKVYGCSFNGNKIQIPHINTNFAFNKYLSTLKKNIKVLNFSKKFGDFDEMTQFGYESQDGMTYKNIFMCENVIEFYIKDVEVCLVPWHDGVMVQSIVVPPNQRKNGIGTEIMNQLYDISESTNIPLYLIAYPGEEFNPKDEFKLVNKLKVWYENLGFGPALNHKNYWFKVWTNME